MNGHWEAQRRRERRNARIDFWCEVLMLLCFGLMGALGALSFWQ